jgi:hypothetical protein
VGFAFFDQATIGVDQSVVPTEERSSTDETSRVTLFESAMGPHIGGSIVAVQHNLNLPLVSLMVGIGITLSFFTLPVWSYLLHSF